MEVHAHTHTARKKWTHYFWEFLMLFLAVFCGFMAENFREHLIEHRKEKAFAKSLWEDLQKDTTRLKYSINRLRGNLTNAESLYRLFIKKDKNKTDENDMARHGYRTGFSVDVVFIDRTSSQLKGTGSMRLIRNKEVADSLLQYWNNQYKISQVHDRFEIFRVEQRKIGWKTFNWYPLNFSTFINSDTIGVNFPAHDIKNISVGINNPQLINEFLNCVSTLYNNGVSQYLPELEQELALAINLIALIREKYHIK